MTALIRRYVRVQGGIPVLRCDDCHARHRSTSYWPLTEDYWFLRRPGALRRCRACWTAENTAQMADRRKRGGLALSVREAAYRRHYLERKRMAA